MSMAVETAMQSIVKDSGGTKRRPLTPKIVAAALVVSSSLPCAFSSCAASPDRPPDNEKAYRVVHGWPVLPDNEMLDEVSAVAVDRHDNVLVLTRAGRKWPNRGELDTSPIRKSTIFLFDGKSGRLLKRWGAGVFALPHSITVDARGNIWVTDLALHQVFKFSATGKLIMTLGKRAEAGNDPEHFDRPSDVAVTSDGSIFVSDGYGNNRVARFNADGKFLLAWGRKGSDTGEFDLPHAIAADGPGRICVDDRNNARIQCFDGNGHFLFAWKGPPFVARWSNELAAMATTTASSSIRTGSRSTPMKTFMSQISKVAACRNL